MSDDISSEHEQNVQEANVARSTVLMTLGTLLSRVTGLVRTWVMAYALGVGMLASSYQVANNLPNIIYEIIAGGMIAAAFLPVLMSVKASGEREMVNRYCSNILNIVFVVLGAVSLAGMVFAEPLVATQTFTVDGQSEVVAQSVWFFRIFSIQVLLYGVSGILQGMLNAERSFFLTALAPAINNLIVIASFASYAVLADSNGSLALAILAVGTTLGVAAQAAALVPRIKQTGFKWSLVIDLKDPLLRETIKLSIPTIVFVIACIVGTSCRNAFSLVPTDSGPAMVAYAFLWFQLPYGIIAVSVSRTMFTEMSDAAAQGDMKTLRKLIANGMSSTLVLIIPMAAIVAALSVPLITVFQAGAFGSDGIHQMAQMLFIWAVGLPLYSVMMYAYNVYASIKKFHVYAIMNVIFTAMQVGLYAVLVNTGLGLNGIPVADFAYYTLFAVTSFAFMGRYVGNISIGFSDTAVPILKTSVISGVVAVAAYCIVTFALPAPDGMLSALVESGIAGITGAIIIFATAHLAKVPQISVMANSFRKR